MAQGLQEFYYQIQKRSIIRDFQFRVVQIGGTNFNDDDLVLAQSSTLPGKEIQTQTVKHSGFDFVLPSTVKYAKNISIDFIATHDWNIRNELERLMDQTYSVESTEGSIGNGGAGDLSIPGQERRIQLDLINDDLSVSRTYYLIGCFITKIEDSTFTMAGNGAPMMIKANIAYQYYTTVPGVGERGKTTLEKVETGIQRGTRVVSAIEKLSKTIGKVF